MVGVHLGGHAGWGGYNELHLGPGGSKLPVGPLRAADSQAVGSGES